jgi:hypothetical protein
MDVKHADLGIFEHDLVMLGVDFHRIRPSSCGVRRDRECDKAGRERNPCDDVHDVLP